MEFSDGGEVAQREEVGGSKYGRHLGDRCVGGRVSCGMTFMLFHTNNLDFGVK